MKGHLLYSNKKKNHAKQKVIKIRKSKKYLKYKDISHY